MIKLEKFGSCMHARTAIDRQTDGTIRTVEDLYDPQHTDLMMTRRRRRLSPVSPSAIDVLSEDGLVAVLSLLSDLRDVGHALGVCTAWYKTITHHDEIWQRVALETWPTHQHAMTMLQLGWKARCLLLTRRRIPRLPPKNEHTTALSKLRTDYAFFLSINNCAEGAEDAVKECCGVSMQATVDVDNGAFTVEVAFPPTDFGAGVIGPWLDPELEEVDACDGFGSLGVDVYMRRLSDGKVAHFASLNLHFKDPDNDNVAFPTPDGCITVCTEDRSCCTPWLIEQAAAMWPPLDMGFPSNYGRRYRKFLVSDHDDGPGFVPRVALEMELPLPDEHNDDDHEISSGKIKSLKIEFRWESILHYQDLEDPVTPVYVAHVLTGPSIEWV